MCIMELTIRIDTRKKDAKVFLEYIKSLSFVSFSKKEEEPVYNKKFVKKIKDAEKRAEYVTINPDNVWESLGLESKN